jgi:hypothetical protein
MRRLIALIWLGLSLALASGPAFAVPSADCPMATSSDMTPSHHQMDCCADTCAPSCAALCPGTIMQAKAPQAGRAKLDGGQLVAWTAGALESVDLPGTDPPPRTLFV